MTRLLIKPLSVNDAYRGRRYDTPEKKQYTQDVAYLLPPMRIPPGPLEIRYRFGVSNMGADVDGPVKVFQDCLARKYGFNDNRVHRIVAEKFKAAKGKEWVEFEIIAYE